MKVCYLHDRNCIQCGECMICDLDPNKTCDNCEQCLGTKDEAYRELLIDEIRLETEEQ